ncbi:ribonuclease H-like domain-containing protein [Mycena polygramma]|nr:ribonuclease H-like domain-containing protein [Mycena polygramma]
MGPFNFQKAKRIGRKLLGTTVVKEPALVFEHARVETPGNPPLNVFPHEEYRIHYLTEEGAVNRALEGILDGVVGFNTEYGKRIPTDEEAFITQALNDVGGQKKWGVLAWQIMEQRPPKQFAIPWDNIALCLVQIARDSDVWVVDLRKMRAYPKELKRILDSPDIVKAGVGVTADIAHVWADLRTNIHNVVDAGCMARLLLAHKYSDNQFGNLSLQVSAAEILGYDINKEERESDWTGDITKAQKLYAATDAAVSLRLYERLVPALEQHRRSLGVSILENWYTMNGKYGEPMRKNLTIRGEEATWSVKDCYWFTGSRFQGYT